jgi:hypothetical protein
MSDCKEAVRLPSIINMEIEANKLHSVQVNKHSEPVFVNSLRSPGIDSQPGGTVRQPRLHNGAVSEGSLGIELRPVLEV